MKRIIVTIISSIMLEIILSSISWGLTITKPVSGTIFHSGDNVVVKAEASPGENLKGIFFITDKMEKSSLDLQTPYEFEFKIDEDFIGTLTIVADGKLVDNRHVEARVQIGVVLPPSVTLKSIKVYPEIMFLFKLPSGSDPNRIRIAEAEDLGVSGVYSDGIEREITTAGTTYTSSDEKIATVTADGEVKAQGVGTATITVKNGDIKATVKVIVKSKDK